MNHMLRYEQLQRSQKCGTMALVCLDAPTIVGAAQNAEPYECTAVCSGTFGNVPAIVGPY